MLLLPKFDYYEPDRLDSAIKMLCESNGLAKIIAGGTDLLVSMKKRLTLPECLISLRKIPDVFRISGNDRGCLIGSHVSISEICESVVIKSRFQLLSKAASVLGSPLIRNRATIGGNIVSARPAADLPPPLIALNASLTLCGANGYRQVPAEDFFVGPGKTTMTDDEILLDISINDTSPFSGGEYIKLGHRRALEIAIVAVASLITLDGPEGAISDAKIILSAVAPKAVHAISAEKALIGEKPTDELFYEAGKLAGKDCSPVDDLRGSAGYRCAMVEVLTSRALKGAYTEAAKGVKRG